MQFFWQESEVSSITLYSVTLPQEQTAVVSISSVGAGMTKNTRK